MQAYDSHIKSGSIYLVSLTRNCSVLAVRPRRLIIYDPPPLPCCQHKKIMLCINILTDRMIMKWKKCCNQFSGTILKEAGGTVGNLTNL